MIIALKRFLVAEDSIGKYSSGIQKHSREHRTFYEKTVLYLLYFYLVIDTLNGFFVQNLGLPSIISVVYKQAILFLVLLYSLLFEPKRCFWCVFGLVLIFFWAILRFLVVDNINFTHAFQEILKVFYPFFLALVLSRFSALSDRGLILAVKIVLSILVFNILSTLAGFGHSAYEGNSIGAKGFFYAANSLSGILVIAASVVLVDVYKRNFFTYFAMTLFLLSIAALIGTKGGVLGVFLVAVLVILFQLDARGLVFFLFGLSGISITLFFFGDDLSNNFIVQRLIYFYETGGIQRALFSGRVEKMDVLAPLMRELSVKEFMFGLDRLSMIKAGVTRVEFDWFDMLIYFGAPFTALTYLGYLFVFARFAIANRCQVVTSGTIAFIVLLIMSSIAGHIIFNAMVTPLLGLLMATVFKYSNKMQEPKI